MRNDRVVYALIIINKAGGLIYQRDFAEGLNKLSVNDYLVLAGTFHGFVSLLPPRLDLTAQTNPLPECTQYLQDSILSTQEPLVPRQIRGQILFRASRCSRRRTSGCNASAPSRGRSSCCSRTRISRTSTQFRGGYMICIRTT